MELRGGEKEGGRWRRRGHERGVVISDPRKLATEQLGKSNTLVIRAATELPDSDKRAGGSRELRLRGLIAVAQQRATRMDRRASRNNTRQPSPSPSPPRHTHFLLAPIDPSHLHSPPSLSPSIFTN